eukprot:CAMPEP_0175601460 /NCGR_PEP_ID=MMETSP0096-20121207/58133_1 /TAXON_ID=311494 /ORGANISM="Alexandrium monilatum, Strain CCMP3105" /LENGTH=108 /DNA_ID=CAMNT_0016906103 /DNA_START=117 /DNA_END=440 /DNA_ORIENTATION=+
MTIGSPARKSAEVRSSAARGTSASAPPPITRILSLRASPARARASCGGGPPPGHRAAARGSSSGPSSRRPERRPSRQSATSSSLAPGEKRRRLHKPACDAAAATVASA